MTRHGGKLLVDQLVVHGTELAFCVPGESYLEVLDAERNLFSSELALTQAQRQELVAGVQLYKALGGAWTNTSGSR